jgi:hypothetical protein
LQVTRHDGVKLKKKLVEPILEGKHIEFIATNLSRGSNCVFRKASIVKSIPHFIEAYSLDNGFDDHRLIGTGFLDDRPCRRKSLG